MHSASIKIKNINLSKARMYLAIAQKYNEKHKQHNNFSVNK